MLEHTSQGELLHLFRRQGGFLTARDAAHAGVPSVALTRLLQHGLIERLQRGVYRLTDTSALPEVAAEVEDLLELQLRYPFARPCLISALHLHGLTTTRPAALQLAVPANHRRPTPAFPAIEVFFFSSRHYAAGVTTLSVRSRELTTYTLEKTLTDLLRYAPKYGRGIYLEGLKKYLRRPGVRRQVLADTVKEAGVWKELARDLEVLSHDQDH